MQGPANKMKRQIIDVLGDATSLDSMLQLPDFSGSAPGRL